MQTCVRSAILAVLIQILHEGRLISSAVAYEGMSNIPKQNKRSTVENVILSHVALSIKLLVWFL